MFIHVTCGVSSICQHQYHSSNTFVSPKACTSKTDSRPKSHTVYGSQVKLQTVRIMLLSHHYSYTQFFANALVDLTFMWLLC